MPIYLRQATASQEVPLGYFVDSTDGNTEETALTIANTDILVWKTGATTLAAKTAGGATHISNGIYYTVLDATDTDTIGPLVLFVHVAGALAVRLECVVLDEAVYDTLFGTTALSTYAGGAVASVTGNVGGNVTGSVGSVAAGGIAAASFAAGAIDAAAIATGAVDADALAADAGTELATALLDLANGVETSYTVRQALRLVLASVSGVLSGAATTSITIKAPDGLTDRIAATVDADGNRTAVTLTP